MSATAATSSMKFWIDTVPKGSPSPVWLVGYVSRPRMNGKKKLLRSTRRKSSPNFSAWAPRVQAIVS
jgi:hypothetical protein